MPEEQLRRSLNNPWEIYTRRNFLLCKEVVTETTNSLAVEFELKPEIEPIYIFFRDFADVYLAKYADWNGQRKFIQTAKTATFQTAYASLQPKMKLWHEAIIPLLRPANRELSLQLFPDDNYGMYTSGSEEQRLSNFGYYTSKLVEVNLPILSTYKTEAVQLQADLGNTGTNKDQSIDKTGSLSSILEAQRLIVTTALYRVQARLCDIFAENPLEVQRIMPFNLLDQRGQTEFVNNNLRGADTLLFLTRTFEDETQQLRIRNMGTQALQFFRSEQKNGAPGVASITVEAGLEITIPVSMLGEGRYFFVRNLSEDVDGAYVVEVE